MPEPTITAVLSPSEWRLVQAIRSLPESRLRDRMTEVLDGLLFYVQNPRCEGMGVEGFPCGDPVSTCEECHQIWDLLGTIADRVEKANHAWPPPGPQRPWASPRTAPVRGRGA